MYNLEVVYPANLYFKKFDEKIYNIVPVECAGGGLGFGMRDLSFYFKSQKEANIVANDLRKLHKKIEVYVNYADWLDEDDNE